ncbi:hypothetical protein K402DRAFT_458705 [Aulographum hederae CBS 113979]|uniref:Uncharacterized protein n=1 Tax=Aulographum hederae CBS 113979 TaxID=1176131 RepID=A0A6G1HGQ7_9PEZI|nr:hypothetical protein K402DRAFT_458705 [Aulographum hederae CBS 113979]
MDVDEPQAKPRVSCEEAAERLRLAREKLHRQMEKNKDREQETSEMSSKSYEQQENYQLSGSSWGEEMGDELDEDEPPLIEPVKWVSYATQRKTENSKRKRARAKQNKQKKDAKKQADQMRREADAKKAPEDLLTESLSHVSVVSPSGNYGTSKKIQRKQRRRLQEERDHLQRAIESSQVAKEDKVAAGMASQQQLPKFDPSLLFGTSPSENQLDHMYDDDDVMADTADDLLSEDNVPILPSFNFGSALAFRPKPSQRSDTFDDPTDEIA